VPRKQEAVVVAVKSCGQVVVDARHHNVDIREGGAIVGVRHIATYPYVNLQEGLGRITLANRFDN